MKDIRTAAGELAAMLDEYDWLYDIKIEGRVICAYVDTMGSDVSSLIPDRIDGFQVKMGFTQYLTSEDKYPMKLTIEDLHRMEELN